MMQNLFDRHIGITGGICWETLTEERMKNPKALENFGYKVYSQNDEDGILHEIFRRIGTTTKEFIEFGVQNGLESNGHLLLLDGWKGLWIEGSQKQCDEIKMRFRPVLLNGRLRVLNCFITKENIEELLAKNAFSMEPDLLSIDIDGNDWHVWNAIKKCNPRVVCIEYNAKMPPDMEWIMAYDAGHTWDGSDWHGASLKSMELLGVQKGYQLVATNLRGVNAFFIRNDLINEHFMKEHTSEELYNPLRHNLEWADPGNMTKYCLADQKEGPGYLNYFENKKSFKKYVKSVKLSKIPLFRGARRIMRNLKWLH